MFNTFFDILEFCHSTPFKSAFTFTFILNCFLTPVLTIRVIWALVLVSYCSNKLFKYLYQIYLSVNIPVFSTGILSILLNEREREKERAGHCVLVQYCKKKNTNGIIFISGFLGCIQPCFPLTWTIHDIFNGIRFTCTKHRPLDIITIVQAITIYWFYLYIYYVYKKLLNKHIIIYVLFYFYFKNV